MPRQDALRRACTTRSTTSTTTSFLPVCGIGLLWRSITSARRGTKNRAENRGNGCEAPADALHMANGSAGATSVDVAAKTCACPAKAHAACNFTSDITARAANVARPRPLQPMSSRARPKRGRVSVAGRLPEAKPNKTPLAAHVTTHRHTRTGRGGYCELLRRHLDSPIRAKRLLRTEKKTPCTRGRDAPP